MSTLSIFFDLHSLQDKLDTFGQVYADSLEPSACCHDSLNTCHVTLCDEDSLDSVASYEDSPCDSLDSDEPSHLSSDSLEDQWLDDDCSMRLGVWNKNYSWCWSRRLLG